MTFIVLFYEAYFNDYTKGFLQLQVSPFIFQMSVIRVNKFDLRSSRITLVCRVTC